MTDTDDGLRESGEIDVSFLIDFFDFWDDIGHDGDDHTDGDHYDRNGIDEGLFDFAVELELFFFALGEDFEDLSEFTGRVSHLEHSSVKWREDPGEARGDVDDIFPGFDSLFEVDSHIPDMFVLGLEIDDLNGSDDGDSRINKTPKVIEEENFFFACEVNRLHTGERIKMKYSFLSVSYNRKICKKTILG